jgi:hypothetical protein
VTDFDASSGSASPRFAADILLSGAFGIFEAGLLPSRCYLRRWRARPIYSFASQNILVDGAGRVKLTELRQQLPSCQVRTDLAEVQQVRYLKR